MSELVFARAGIRSAIDFHGAYAPLTDPSAAGSFHGATPYGARRSGSVLAQTREPQGYRHEREMR
jgi:hypothetical protein